MNYLPNIFQNFDNLYQVNIPNIQSKLPFSLPPKAIENYVANRLLFPMAIPQSAQDNQLDLAMLSAIVSLNTGFFYNQTLGKITIPSEYTLVYQNIDQLVEAVVTSVHLGTEATVIIPNPTGHNTTGSVIALPAQHKPLDVIYVGKKYQVPIGKVLHLSPQPTAEISINTTIYQLPPGELGIYIISLDI